jgi:hypothetical protein
VTDDATRHNQAAYDGIAGLYAERQADLSRSFADLTAAFLDRLPPAAGVADLGCGPAMRRVLRQDGHVALITALGQGTRLEPVPYAPHTKRWFFYRDPAELDDQLRRAEFQVLARTEEPTSRHWVKILARPTRPAGAPAATR